jgi:hypothetical protein
LKRHNDSGERLIAHALVEQAQRRLDILIRGVAGELLECAGRGTYASESLRFIVNHLKDEVFSALKNLENAEESYEPFRSRRRLPIRRSRLVKPTKAA